MNKYSAIIISCIFCFVAEAYGQNDSIKSVTLDEVVVSADNIYRQEDHLVIIPTKEQKDHSPTGYALLYNLMILGMSIQDNGSVSTMGMNTSLYINGQPTKSPIIPILQVIAPSNGMSGIFS